MTLASAVSAVKFYSCIAERKQIQVKACCIRLHSRILRKKAMEQMENKVTKCAWYNGCNPSMQIQWQTTNSKSTMEYENLPVMEMLLWRRFSGSLK